MPSPSTTSSYEGALGDGGLLGSLIFAGSSLVAIDFNRSYVTDEPTQTCGCFPIAVTQTGRLERLP